MWDLRVLGNGNTSVALGNARGGLDAFVEVAGPEEYWARTWSHIDRALYEAMDAATLERYRGRAMEHLAAQHARGELVESLRVLLLAARHSAGAAT